MTDVQRFLEEFAAIGDGPPVVTLYLDCAWRDEHQRERVRLFFRERSRDAERLFADGPQLSSVLDTLEELGAWVDRLVNQEIHPDANGVCLVASAPRGLLRAAVVSDPLPMAMYVDTRPRLAPLVEAVTSVGHAFLVVVGQTGAQILELLGGEVVEESAIEREVGRIHRKGGWSSHKIQRNVRDHIRGVWRESADLLTRLVKGASEPAIVLFGQEPALRAFQKLLPREVLAHVVDQRPAAPTRSELLASARAALRDERLARDYDEVHRVVGAALSGGSAVVGLRPVLEASNERRIHELVLEQSFDALGFLCSSCGALAHAGGTGCVYCGAMTRVVPLREELVRRCLLEGASIRVVVGGTSLEPYRGVGALLRHVGGESRYRPGPSPGLNA